MNKVRTQDYTEEYLDSISNNNHKHQNVSQEHVHVQQEQTSPNANAKLAGVFALKMICNNFILARKVDKIE